MGDRPAGRHAPTPAHRDAVCGSAIPGFLRHRPEECQRTGAPALHPGRDGPAVARSRGLSHALRRRAGAAAERGRPIRHHECRRRAPPALSRSAAARARARSRLHRRRRRLGEGRRLQHDLLAHRAAAAHAPDRPIRRRRGSSRTIPCTASIATISSVTIPGMSRRIGLATRFALSVKIDPNHP